MRLSISRGRRYAGLASVVAPVVVLVLAKAAGLGPLASQAALSDPEDEGQSITSADRVKPVKAEGLLQLPPESVLSLARSRELREQPASSLSSPFYQRPVLEEEPAVLAPPVQQTAPTAPAFVLSGVMNGRPPIAVIDGNVHRPGDDLGGGWSIESIDARKLLVTLRHTDGRVHLLNGGQP